MKFSNMVAVVASAVAVVASGCKYNKAGGGQGGGSGDSAFNGQEIATDAEEVSVGDIESQTGSLASAEAAGVRFEDLYQRCGDVAFSPVYFGFDSSVVPQGELGKIEAVASHLADNPGRVVVIEGHCDERGSNEYNVVLGDSRAKIVRNYLVQNGIAADRIQERSYGEERPAEQGTGEAVWAKNRRAEFAVFQK